MFALKGRSHGVDMSLATVYIYTTIFMYIYTTIFIIRIASRCNFARGSAECRTGHGEIPSRTSR